MGHLTLETKSAAPAKAPPPARERANDRETKHLPVPFQIKADSLDDEARTFTGLASTWDLDLGGDVIHRGAFKRTLDHWRKSGRVLPLLDSHNAWSSVRAVIGKAEEAKETADGLETTFSVIDGPDGDEIWRRLKGGFVDGLSIGYRPVKIEMPSEEEERAGVWRHLKEVELREVSVVLWPMNEGARVDTESVKSLAQAAEALLEAAKDRELSDEEKGQLKELQDGIGALLADPPAKPSGSGQEGDADDDAAEPKGLAADDPARMEMEARLRRMRLIRLEREGRRAS